MLLREEAEKRGVGWGQLLGGDVADLPEAYLSEAVRGVQEARDAEDAQAAERNTQPAGERHSAWSDGTFQVGTIRNGEIVMDDESRREETEVTSVAETMPRAVNGNGMQVNGTGTTQGGRLSDEELRRRLAEQMGEDEDGGLHL